MRPFRIYLITTILFTSIFTTLSNPKAIDVLQSQRQLEEHPLNFCNQTELALENGLQKTTLGQFMGYPCSPEFYHCRWQSDGYHTYKKNCRIGLVFDTLGTQNCNYDYNVKTCGMQSAPEKCVNATDFACPLSETCVSLGQRCDGIYDCILEEDEQNCPMCKADEFPCITSEQCIPMSGRCNGIKECRDGTDEMDCEECPAGNFLCRKSNKCVPSALRCDGHNDCPQGEDEALCKKDNSQMYICENRKDQVAKTLVCDGKEDCPDGSDEKYCLRPALPVPEGTAENNEVSTDVTALQSLAISPMAASTAIPTVVVPLPAPESLRIPSSPRQTGKVTASFPRVQFGSSISTPASQETTVVSQEAGDDDNDSMHNKPTVQMKKYRIPNEKLVRGDTVVDCRDACYDKEDTVAYVKENVIPYDVRHTVGHGTPYSESRAGSDTPYGVSRTVGHASTVGVEEGNARGTVGTVRGTESQDTTQSSEEVVPQRSTYSKQGTQDTVPHSSTSSKYSTIDRKPSTTDNKYSTQDIVYGREDSMPHSTQDTMIRNSPPTLPHSSQDTIPVFVGQKGRKTFTPSTFSYRQDTTNPQLAVTRLNQTHDPLQALTDKYGADRNELLRKIETILKTENEPSARPQNSEPFHRLSKTITVTGRPHKWQPSLSTNGPSRTTPIPFHRRRFPFPPAPAPAPGVCC
ncbi:unnamed protein product [Bursaphelenchus okinawaensis]|uniref:Chitin-binding type-2 domain-containing protein n=1 Tax=Bursaphelenchus okinawaensis TaxID=465554 RepID=A0A811LR60_9BILA|nr:unnamed protein product [Bursaphelenchus okinawaensis]CAG9127806.1 unnamed protein product [Bursaphelenchus okinawaensis]